MSYRDQKGPKLLLAIQSGSFLVFITIEIKQINRYCLVVVNIVKSIHKKGKKYKILERYFNFPYSGKIFQYSGSLIFTIPEVNNFCIGKLNTALPSNEDNRYIHLHVTANH